MMQKIKSFFINTHNACIPSFIANDKRKRIIFLVAFCVLLASTFLTVFGQIPFFSTRGLTKLFQFGWVLVLIPLLMLDYKWLIKSLLRTLLLLLPFLLYCLIALLFNIKAITYGGTEVIFLSSFILFVGTTFSKYKTETGLKIVLLGYLIGAILYAGIVYFAVLRGYDLDNPIYAFGDKNSAGPIFMAAAICAYYLFSKRKPLQIIIRWIIILFFIAIIALSKNRAVLVVIPFIVLPMLFIDINSKVVSLVIVIALVLGVVAIFAIPSLYDIIVVKILFNNKTTVDEIFSGRLTQIVNNLQNLKPVLGNGGNYFDCMPLSFLCSYGIIGLITLLPICVFPFYSFIKYRDINSDKRLHTTTILLSVLFLLGSLFEGYGFTGPGAKTFILWFTAGSFSFELETIKKESTLNNIKNKVFNIANIINPKYLILFIQSVLVIVSIITISLQSFSFKIGDTVIDKLPASNQVADYIEIIDNVIDPPVDSMCVGQKITFKTKATPDNAYDKTVYWSTGWIEYPSIVVNGYSGEVTAISSHTALLHINRFRVGPNGVYIQFPVKKYEDYNFNKLFISSSPFTSSFSNIGSEIITLNSNCTTKLYYDTFYLPKKDDFMFVSSNSNIASVDENGIVRAHNPGTCTIKGVINNSFNNESINTITINVKDETFIPVSSFNIDTSKPCYQYEPYNFSALFNENASDKNILVDVNGLDCTQNGNSITFNEVGTATIKVSSQNNPSYTQTFDINVIENPPVKFMCETNRILIGEKKNATQLGLYIVYKNGYKKVVSDDDIYFHPFDFTNRAWTNQNGLIENRTTIYAVKKGTIKLNYISKIDQNIKGTFNITCSAYTAEQYAYLCNGVGTIALSFVLLITLIFSLFVNIKRKWILFALLTATTGLFITISFLLYGISPFTIIPAIVNLIALITVIFLRIVIKNRFPLKFLEEPAEYAPTISDIKVDENITI